MSVLNSATGLFEPFNACLAFYRERHLLRIHVTSAYAERTGEGSPDTPVNKMGSASPRLRGIRKEPRGAMPPRKCRIGRSRKSEGPERRIPLKAGFSAADYIRSTGQNAVT